MHQKLCATSDHHGPRAGQFSNTSLLHSESDDVENGMSQTLALQSMPIVSPRSKLSLHDICYDSKCHTFICYDSKCHTLWVAMVCFWESDIC